MTFVVCFVLSGLLELLEGSREKRKLGSGHVRFIVFMLGEIGTGCFWSGRKSCRFVY